MTVKPKPRTTALVVSDDSGLTDNLAGWLEADGMEVMVCPGPRAPHFNCVGLRGEPCPLLAGSDLVLLDLHPEPGGLVDRSGRSQLVQHYARSGRQLLVMVDGVDNLEILGVDGVAVMDRQSEREEVLASVWELVDGQRNPAGVPEP